MSIKNVALKTALLAVGLVLTAKAVVSLVKEVKSGSQN
jgi:hypothetical protein